MAHRVAIDIGGTFTDLVDLDSSGRLRTSKVLSTPPALVNGVLEALGASGVDPLEIELFVHGTTQGLNAILERRGARVALVTTTGFRDVYLIGRGHRPDMYNLRYRKPEPLLQRDAIFEVNERLDARGEVVVPLSEADVAEVGERILEGGFEAVAICFLHSYVNPAHERRAKEILVERLPKCCVVTSSEVAPEWREYERTSTTVASAYITPIMRNYLGELERNLRLRGLRGPVYITESNGGVMAAELAQDYAIGTLLSGPIGGVVGARSLAEQLGERDIIAVDVGGTSFDVSLVREGKASVQSEFDLQGLPLLAPAVEIHTIGAGGGSIISIGSSGRLKVGPESAGAVPGPVCYGRGGSAPTVTDAHVVLGHIPPEQLLGGTLRLDLRAATEALAVTGARLGLDATELAIQALEVINFRMAEAIRELTVERGLDPASFALCAFGGAGGLHASALADELGVTRVFIPALPGSFSAWGMLQGGIRHDVTQSFFRSVDEAARDLAPALEALEERARTLLGAEGVAPERVFLQASANMRYVGQEYSLAIELPASRQVDDLVASFHERYRQRYGHANPGEEVELVALRVAANARFEDPPVPEEERRGSGKPTGTCSAFFGGSAHVAQLWRREDVIDLIEGPALVLEDTATTLVPPGWSCRPTVRGHLVLERGGTR